MQRATQKGFRLHICIFGRRNVGKSSLMNAITRQQVSIVSATAGTTTDPVEKPMELLPIGPVLFVDTAGVDDEGALGEQRIERTRQVIARSDLALLVTEPGRWSAFEEQVLAELSARRVPVLIVLNKIDLCPPPDDDLRYFEQQHLSVVAISASTGQGLDELRTQLQRMAPAVSSESTTILRDLVPAGETAVFVMPIDREAPKGRIKQLQVASIRDLLDGNSPCIVVQPGGLKAVLDNLRRPPALVVTDAQVFDQVAQIVPASVPLTAFSILLARLKGDLVAQARNVTAIDGLQRGDRILIAESCTHHPIEDDIGRVKIPNWLRHYVGGDLTFESAQGHDFPADLTPYKLVVHCGACMNNRREMLARIEACTAQRVPITNYGIAIAYALGILSRALEPFPDALEAYRTARREWIAVEQALKPANERAPSQAVLA
jgi:[FeFe] hydrogenase H-cluster maturation GTPase HydF